MKGYLFVLVLSLLTFGFLSPSASADTIYTPTKYNGYKVYLSPAKHTPDKTGCSNFSENHNALILAQTTASTLNQYGYLVRVGSGDPSANIASSNSWGSQLHLPIHSNAKTGFVASTDCKVTDTSIGAAGTWLMYNSNAGNISAARAILNTLGPLSPGLNDRLLTDKEGSGIELGELTQTRMPAAYIEVGFHTFMPDVTWMGNNKSSIASAIARGVHSFSGANDCRTQTCAMASSLEQQEGLEQQENLPSTTLNTYTIDTPFVEEKPVVFDTEDFGKKSLELEKALNTLLSGKNADFIFGDYLKGTLNSVHLNEKGTAVVDFDDLSEKLGFLSTHEKGILINSLKDVLFKNKNVKEIYFTFNGNFTEWVNWLATVYKPITRD